MGAVTRPSNLPPQRGSDFFVHCPGRRPIQLPRRYPRRYPRKSPCHPGTNNDIVKKNDQNKGGNDDMGRGGGASILQLGVALFRAAFFLVIYCGAYAKRRSYEIYTKQHKLLREENKQTVDVDYIEPHMKGGAYLMPMGIVPPTPRAIVRSSNTVPHGSWCRHKQLRIAPWHSPGYILTLAFPPDDPDSSPVSPEDSFPSWHDKRCREKSIPK